LIAFPAFSLSTLSNNWYLFKYEFLLLPVLFSVIACGFYGGIFLLILGVTLSEVCYCWEYVFLFFLFWKYKNSFKNYIIKIDLFLYFYLCFYTLCIYPLTESNPIVEAWRRLLSIIFFHFEMPSNGQMTKYQGVFWIYSFFYVFWYIFDFLLVYIHRKNCTMIQGLPKKIQEKIEVITKGKDCSLEIIYKTNCIVIRKLMST